MNVRMSDDEAADTAWRWCAELLRRCKIRVHRFENGTHGLVDVPAKYAAAIDGLHKALFCALVGEDLPEFTPEEPPGKRKRTRRTP
jgi:hypothetical protein